MRWKNACFLIVVCGQVSLVSILIYLIRACNESPKQIKVQERAGRTDNVSVLDNMGGTESNGKTFSPKVLGPTSTLTKKPATRRKKYVNEKVYSSETAVNNKTHGRNKEISSTANRRRTRLKLVVAILSAPIRFDRREGIRRTWMKQCKSENVVCRFFTDSLADMESKVQVVLAEESTKHGDLVFMPIPKGYNFGLRLLWLMEWSMARYEFDFFLRMDDDYFVCLKRLLFEIPFRPQKRLYWGYVHCEVEGLVRIDEGFLILAEDLVREFLSKKQDLLCHPFGDQTVALWMNDVKNVIYFHDPRIYHDVTAHIPEFKSLQEVCGNYISLHGSYLHEMLHYWKIASEKDYFTYWVPSIQPISNLCPLSTHFDWRAMGGPPYGWEPKPCVLQPIWNLGNMHRGRNMM